MTKSDFKKIVQLWVEMMHIDFELGSLVEDSDEVGELFEFDNWLKDPKRKEKSIMGLHVAIEQAEKISYELKEEAETKLKTEIINIINNNDTVKFFGKEIVNINADNMDELFEILLEDFDKIYDYQSDEQYKGFIECLLNADKLIVQGKIN